MALYSNCPLKFDAKYRKCFPSGRNTGQRWLAWKRDLSGLVSSTGEPPAEDTRYNPWRASPVNRTTPSWFQVPPRPLGASQITWACPPDACTFLSLPSAKKPMNLPSGDQNG